MCPKPAIPRLGWSSLRLQEPSRSSCFNQREVDCSGASVAVKQPSRPPPREILNPFQTGPNPRKNRRNSSPKKPEKPPNRQPVRSWKTCWNSSLSARECRQAHSLTCDPINVSVDALLVVPDGLFSLRLFNRTCRWIQRQHVDPAPVPAPKTGRRIHIPRRVIGRIDGQHNPVSLH